MEQFSIDEFFGDVTGWIKDEDVYEFAVKLKQKIKNDLGLPVSIGVSQSKWIAKLATEFAKPFGVRYIPTKEVPKFISDIPISKLIFDDQPILLSFEISINFRGVPSGFELSHLISPRWPIET